MDDNSKNYHIIAANRTDSDLVKLSGKEDEIRAAEGTRAWLLMHESYRIWRNKSSGLLWILGSLGSGKSTLVRYALQNLRNTVDGKEIIAAFFIHGRGSELQKSPLGLYRSLLHQVLPSFPEHSNRLSEVYRGRTRPRSQYAKAWTWTAKELRDVLISLMKFEAKANDNIH